MRSPSQYSFARVPQISIPRSSFKRDRTLKTGFNAGLLVPFYWDEVYPGDTFNVHSTVFGRLATPITPFMDNLYLDVFYFYVPYRILWNHWNNMLGEQANPDDSIDYLTPILGHKSGASVVGGLTSVTHGSLADYFGLPVRTFGAKGLECNSFLFRAYNKIWNDHFRDENLQDSAWFDPTSDGPDDIANFTLLRRGKRKDYFTSCLPWPQKGPGAEISLGSNVPVFGDGNALAFTQSTSDSSTPFQMYLAPANNFVGGVGKGLRTSPTLPGYVNGNVSTAVSTTALNREAVGLATESQVANISGSTSGLYADLSSATPLSINDMRMAFQLQKFLEQSARSGSRAPEIILGHFGVVCPDFRLQRSEYLGGGEVPIQIHQVLQTNSDSSAEVDSPLGTTGAYGILSGRCGFSKSFVEHGVVIGLVSCRADLNYWQGLERSWSRRSRFDFYWPELAHLGEQAVLNKEIYAQGTDDDDKAFGYQERWAELRYGMSHLTGPMRPDATVYTVGDFWSLAQRFDSLPTLSAEWIEDNPPLDRVLALQSDSESAYQIIFDSLTQCNCVRPMPMYSVPGLIDHPV